MPEWLNTTWNAVSPFNDAIGMMLGIWGAVLSSALAMWEYRKRRLNLSSTYAFYGTDDIADEIVVVNLSAMPVFVKHWTLIWVPQNWFSKAQPLDITPDDLGGFKIAGEDSITLKFDGQNKIPWSYRVSEGRKLVLTLYIHGKSKPKRLKISRG